MKSQEIEVFLLEKYNYLLGLKDVFQ